MLNNQYFFLTPWIYNHTPFLTKLHQVLKSYDVFSNLIQDQMVNLPILDFRKKLQHLLSIMYKKPIRENFRKFMLGGVHPIRGLLEHSRRQTLCDIKHGINGITLYITFTVIQWTRYSISCPTDVGRLWLSG